MAVAMLWLVSFVCVAVAWLAHSCWRLLDYFCWTPRRLGAAVARQGIRGPPPSNTLLGNVPQIVRMRTAAATAAAATTNQTLRQCDLVGTLLPDYALWSKLYGNKFLMWWGPEASLALSDTTLIKEMFSSRTGLPNGKPYLGVQKFLEPLLGQGIVSANGEDWAHKRKCISPAFYFENLKDYAQTMIPPAEKMLKKWDNHVNEGNGKSEIEIGEDMTEVIAEITTLTQFGSSYEQGKKIFQDLEFLRDFVFHHGHYLIIPGSRFFPFASFRKMRKIKKRVDHSIRQLIQERKDNGQKLYKTNLLSLLLKEGEPVAMDEKIPQLTIQQIVDECKTIFFAGHDTTAKLLTWTSLLLAEYPSWQERARVEIFEKCGSSPPKADSLSQMKTLDAILSETLRLYPPVIITMRAALGDMKLGDMDIPKGMAFTIPILAIHHDKEVWGEDAGEFHPERFAHGVGKACKKGSIGYMPFLQGPRNCVGQNLALMEAKLVMAMVLQRFRLEASPNYRHCPASELTLRPRFGAPVILHRLDQFDETHTIGRMPSFSGVEAQMP